MSHGRMLLWAAVVASLLLLTLYVAVRTFTTFVTDHTWAQALAAACLLAAEVLVALQAVGYLGSLAKATRHADRCRPRAFVRPTAAPVAVIVASFNEAEEMLDETLASVRALDYPAVTLYLVDDSTRDVSRRAAATVAARYGARLVHRETRAGYKAGAINDLIPGLTEPYVAILDADQRPTAFWLRDIVPILDADPRVAFVQAPQIYSNLAGLPVAHAAAHQQAVFYEYICEGKAVSNAMFCCGSNVVFRREALLSVGVLVDGRQHYFDERSVTEDFATSFKLHQAGWTSCYVNRSYVTGIGPETLAAYFTQQSRWAFGTLGMLVQMFRRLVREPRSLRPDQWSEYLLSGMYYLVGVTNVVFIGAAVAFLLFGVQPVAMDARLYVALFIPYFAFTMGTFFVTLRRRGYPARDIWLGTALTFGTSCVFIKAAGAVLLGRHRSFGVTPKAVGGTLPLRRLAPEACLLMVCLAGATAGIATIAREGLDTPLLVTTAWSAYHATLLATLFVYFNRRVAVTATPPLFERVAPAS